MMQTFSKTEGSTETKIKWLTYLFLLEEYVAELDAIVNGPAAFGNPILYLSEREWESFLDTMLNPPEPSEGLIALIKECRGFQK
jgi:uncharacterized protein (DUF1778 family)